MANFLGIEYYRLLREFGENSWFQVFTKTVFNIEEAESRGEIFGVIGFTDSNKADKGIKVLQEFETWVMQSENKGDLGALVESAKKKGLVGAFVWVVLDEDRSRKVKAAGIGGVKVGIVRDQKLVWLVTEDRGGVVIGSLKDGDKLIIASSEILKILSMDELTKTKDWVGLAEEITTKLGTEGEVAGAGLLLSVLPWSLKNYEKELKTETVVVPETKKIEEKLFGERLVGKVTWKDKLSNRFQRISRLFLKREVVVKTESVKKRHRLVLGIGLIFLLIFIASVLMGLVKSRAERNRQRIDSVLGPVERKIQEAEGLYSLNPSGARELVRSASEELETKKSQLKEKDEVAKLKQIEQRLETVRQKVSGEVKVNSELFFGLELIRAGMKGQAMSYDGRALVIVDKDLGIVSRISYPDKKQELVMGKGEGEEWKDVVAAKEGILVLRKEGFLWKRNDRTMEVRFDDSVLEAVAVEEFGTNAYVLDRGASEIWKYAVTEDSTTAERRRWFTVQTEVNLNEASDIAVDGDIWVAKKDGKVLRFRRGNQERFNLTDLPDALRIDRLAAQADGGLLALLDKDNSRVVLINKEGGSFVRQLADSEFKQALDLVWVDNFTLMILVPGKILKVSI